MGGLVSQDHPDLPERSVSDALQVQVLRLQPRPDMPFAASQA
jgi:hypothetical protein